MAKYVAIALEALLAQSIVNHAFVRGLPEKENRDVSTDFGKNERQAAMCPEWRHQRMTMGDRHA